MGLGLTASRGEENWRQGRHFLPTVCLAETALTSGRFPQEPSMSSLAAAAITAEVIIAVASPAKLMAAKQRVPSFARQPPAAGPAALLPSRFVS